MTSRYLLLAWCLVYALAYYAIASYEPPAAYTRFSIEPIPGEVAVAPVHDDSWLLP